MAAFLYDSGRQGFLEGAIDWDTDNIKAALVRGYTPSQSTHDMLDDVTGGGGGTIVATSGNLASKTVTGGVADCADWTWTAVTAGAACAHVVIYKDTGGAASTNRLIACIDDATGLPVTPNGGDITFAVDSGTNKLFKL